MAIDWDVIDVEIGEAADETDAKLAAQIATLTRLKEEEIKRLFPDTADKTKMVQLMQIVNQSGDENRRTAALVDNIKDLAGTAIKLLSRL